MSSASIGTGVLGGRNLGAVLIGIVDGAGVEHLGYPTARRTLCLDHFVAQCSPARRAEDTCSTCAAVRQRMRRAPTHKRDRYAETTEVPAA